MYLRSHGAKRNCHAYIDCHLCIYGLSTLLLLAGMCGILSAVRKFMLGCIFLDLSVSGDKLQAYDLFYDSRNHSCLQSIWSCFSGWRNGVYGISAYFMAEEQEKFDWD